MSENEFGNIYTRIMDRLQARAEKAEADLAALRVKENQWDSTFALMGAEIESLEGAVTAMKAENFKLREQVVQKTEEYCDKFREWAKVMHEAYRECEERKKAGEEPLYPQGEDFIAHLDAVMLAIAKSSLLNRTVYGGQKPRTEKCPLHRGHWSGLSPQRPDYTRWGNSTPCECWDGWEASGWIPEVPVEDFIGNQPRLVRMAIPQE